MNTNTIRAEFGTVPKKSEAQQPKNPLSGTGSLVVIQDGKPVNVITLRTYYTERGSGMQPVRACIWIDGPRVEAGDRLQLSGRGSASGCGYHKESAAIADAVSSCGIALYGNPYAWEQVAGDSDKSFDFGGTGSSAYSEIFKAIARAAGYSGEMLWVSHGL